MELITNKIVDDTTIHESNKIEEEIKAKEIFKDKIIYCKNAKQALKDCDALIILTEWENFKKIRPEVIKKLMI